MKKINTLSQRCSYNLKLKEYTLLVCILFVVSLSSCSDNPVDPGNTSIILDTGRFELSHYEFNHYYHNPKLYIIDTSEFFVISRLYMIGHVKDRVERTFITPNLYPSFMAELNSELFFFSNDFHNKKITVSKWLGNNYINIIENEFSDTVWLMRKHLNHQGKIYFSTVFGRIFTFDGLEFESYSLPDIGVRDLFFVQSYIILEEGTNILKFGGFARDNISGNQLISTIYSFENGKWILEFREVYGEKVSGGDLGLINVLNNKFVRLFWERIETYQNGVWMPFQILDKEVKVDRDMYFDGGGIIAGTDANDFLFTAQVNRRHEFVHWNGENYSIEWDGYSLWSRLEAITMNESQVILLETQERNIKNYLIFLNKKQ